MCKKLGIPVKEAPFTLDELFDADEIIVAACTSFCLPASHIDGKPVGGKAPDLLKKLQNGMLAEFYEAVVNPAGLLREFCPGQNSMLGG
jgi:D-alanine transaminase